MAHKALLRELNIEHHKSNQSMRRSQVLRRCKHMILHQWHL